MKITYVIAAALMLSASSFAQKKELRALKRLDDSDAPPTKENMDEFNGYLTTLEPMLSSMDDEQQADYYYYKGEYALMQVMTNPNNPQALVLIKQTINNFDKTIQLEKKLGKGDHTKDIKEEVYPRIKGQITAIANGLNKNQMFKQASPLFELVVKMDPDDQVALYNAAATALNAQDYDLALEHYIALDKSGFTGEATIYTAKNKQSGEVESFPNIETRDIAVKSGQYEDPKVEKLPSLKGDIVKNIALIYVQKGQVDKAKEAMANARKANPDDLNLIVQEANLYYQTKDMENYKRLISEAIQKSPNNAELYFNLGVVSSENNVDDAIKYYKKALEIDPNYVNALINLGVLMMHNEQKIVDEMNNLGTSAKDNQRYEELKKQREAMYNSALPYLEKAHSVEPDNDDVTSTLANIYQALNRTDDYKAMKAQMKN